MTRRILALLLVIVLCSCSEEGTDVPRRLILDTDISSDADDVGALAVLHAMAQNQDVEFLAVMISSADPWNIRALWSINHYFGRPDIPIGVVASSGVSHTSSYTRELAEMGSGPDVTVTPSVALYRKILAAQADESVTLVTIGYLTNLKDLLGSGPDEHSPLKGLDLVREKVKLLVCMGGDYPRGREWNFFQDARSARYTIAHWPTRIVFLGYKTGLEVLTGKPLREAPEASPVRLAYKNHNDFQGRPSWDQLAVLYGAETRNNRKKWFQLSAPGINTVAEDGANVWQEDPAGSHFFLDLRESGPDLAKKLDSMMMGSR